MAILTIEQIARVALDAGWVGEQAAVATAIGMGESKGDTNARGDTTITTNKWGPSIGVWQIRSLNADRGTGRQRDETANLNVATNARNAFAISGGGANWSPWSVYSSGLYRRHLAQARLAVSNPSTAPAPEGASDTGADSGSGLLGPLFNGGMWMRLGAFLLGGALLLFALYRLTGIGDKVIKVAKVAVQARTGVKI